MLIRNLDAIINDLDGTPIMGPGGKPLTFRSAMVQGLAHENPPNPRTGEQSETGEARFRRWSIANKIQNAESEVELSVEDVSLVKTKTGEAFIMVVVGPVWTLIESSKEASE